MNIAIIGEHNKDGGGSYHQSFKTHTILSKIKEFKFKFLVISSEQKLREASQDSIYYNTNFIDQLFFFFYSSKLLKSILKKFNIENRFEKFLKNQDIDLIFFLGCSRLSLFCDKLDYVTYVYEFHHISRPDLPEYKGWSDFDFREDILQSHVKKSLSVIVDTQKKYDELLKYYRCHEKKINIIPLTSNIIEKVEKKKTISDVINKYINNNKEYYFYPAQYWSHKNHFYILRALLNLNKQKNKLTKFVFTGHRKNNFQYLRKKMNEFSLGDQVTFFEYLNDEDIKILYKNCKALVMPSLVGYSSLPLYEAFYFEKPIFYSKDLLDNSLQKYVTEIDLEDPSSLSNEILNFDVNSKTIHEKVRLAKEYYTENLTNEKITSKYYKFFNKVYNQSKLYK
jgi:hypothetical protein